MRQHRLFTPQRHGEQQSRVERRIGNPGFL